MMATLVSNTSRLRWGKVPMVAQCPSEGLERLCAVQVFRRGDPVGPLEPAAQVALVGKADLGGDFGGGNTPGQQCARPPQPGVHQVGVRRQAEFAAELPGQGVAVHAGMLGHLVHAEIERHGLVARQLQVVRVEAAQGRDDAVDQRGFVGQRRAEHRKRLAAGLAFAPLHCGVDPGQRQVQHRIREALLAAGVAVVHGAGFDQHGVAHRAGDDAPGALELLHALQRHAHQHLVVVVRVVGVSAEMGMHDFDARRVVAPYPDPVVWCGHNGNSLPPGEPGALWRRGPPNGLFAR
ncbi:hypothetical protein Ddc_22788 [Ditylenchus destructor]|nr:hypothetical protein Ddc_22788 [Ditylenchus destructor]